MRYLIFNILLIMLIIVCLFKPYIINECFINMKPDKIGFNVNLEPVEIEIIYSPKKYENVKPIDEVFPTQYSPPFIEQKIIVPVPVPEPVPEVKPVITLQNIMSCKVKLNNRITEINNIKNKNLSDEQELLLNRQMYDQRISAENAETVQKYKDDSASSNQKYMDAMDLLNDVKSKMKDCQLKFQSFGFNHEQVRNCCATETQRAFQMKQYLYEKCSPDKIEMASKLSAIENQIKTINDQINQTKTRNDNLITQTDTCNKEVTVIENKIKNC